MAINGLATKKFNVEHSGGHVARIGFWLCGTRGLLKGVDFTADLFDGVSDDGHHECQGAV